MPELRREAHEVNLTEEVTVLTYTYPGAIPIEVVARIDLGDSLEPIAGGGLYTARFYLDDVLVSPDILVTVNAGVIRTVLASRALPMEPGETLTVRVMGLPADTLIHTLVTLRDVTAAKTADLTSTGAILVDHDYGGTDHLTVMTDEGARVDGASLIVYRTADYQADRRDQVYVVAATSTNVHGHWTSPMLLDAGSYQLVIYKQGVIETKVFPLLVTAP